MRRTAVLLVAVAALAVTTTAAAHRYNPPAPYSSMSLRQQAHYLRLAVHHYQTAARWGLRHPAPRGTAARLPYCAPLGQRATRHTCWHARAAAWTQRSLLRVQAQLAARALPAHYSLWLCIHSREGAWDADTGNGYYGGLQMTWGWLGYISGPASAYAPTQQMQAAERGYRASGYSLAWLYSQWPNTAPLCAALA